MRAYGSGTKKLIVAFHFQFSDQAGWKCDSCRKAGLEMKRRCGWIPAARETPAKAVWARKRVATDLCPKSLVTAQSLAWLEQFYVWCKLGVRDTSHMSAREVEAFLILGQELLAEQDGRG